MISKRFLKVKDHFGIVISCSYTFEYFPSSFFHLCISAKKKKKKKKKKSLKTQSNDHRVVTRGQKVALKENFLKVVVG